MKVCVQLPVGAHACMCGVYIRICVFVSEPVEMKGRQSQHLCVVLGVEPAASLSHRCSDLCHNESLLHYQDEHGAILDGRRFTSFDPTLLFCDSFVVYLYFLFTKCIPCHFLQPM